MGKRLKTCDKFLFMWGLLFIWTSLIFVGADEIPHVHFLPVTHALELSNENILSWSSDKMLIIWDNEGNFLNLLQGHTDGIRNAIQLNNGNILSWADWDYGPLLWDENGNLLAILSQDKQMVLGAIQLSNNDVLIWNSKNLLSFWDTDGNYLRAVSALPQHSDMFSFIQGISEISNGRILAWFTDARILLWNLEGILITSFIGHEGYVSHAEELSNGNILSIASDETIRIWDDTGVLLNTIYYTHIQLRRHQYHRQARQGFVEHNILHTHTTT